MNARPDVDRAIVDPHGKPLRETAGKCPRCGAGRDQRRIANPFGAGTHDECGKCGYQFEELTCER